jgi:hypothetical protein
VAWLRTAVEHALLQEKVDKGDEIEEWAARHGATLHWQEMGVDSLTVRGASKQAADELAWSKPALLHVYFEPLPEEMN